MGGRVRRVFVVRHAPAEARGPQWPDDALRPLTAEGVAKMRQIVDGFASIEEPPELILTSPLVRASHTAELVVAGWPDGPAVWPLPALAPDGTPAQTVKAVAAAARGRDSVALVGHEPDLGALAAWLIGATTPLPFKKGGICRIDIDTWPPRGQGRLIWFATPKMLRLKS